MVVCFSINAFISPDVRRDLFSSFFRRFKKGCQSGHILWLKKEVGQDKIIPSRSSAPFDLLSLKSTTIKFIIDIRVFIILIEASYVKSYLIVDILYERKCHTSKKNTKNYYYKQLTVLPHDKRTGGKCPPKKKFGR